MAADADGSGALLNVSAESRTLAGMRPIPALEAQRPLGSVRAGWPSHSRMDSDLSVDERSGLPVIHYARLLSPSGPLIAQAPPDSFDIVGDADVPSATTAAMTQERKSRLRRLRRALRRVLPKSCRNVSSVADIELRPMA
jgi:hypothetical protein